MLLIRGQLVPLINTVRAKQKMEKIMIKKLLLPVLLFLPYANVMADGPFGTIWGKSISGTEAQGVSCGEKTAKNRFTICKTTKLPKNLSISEQYSLYFDKKYNLQKVTMISKDITGDPYGSDGKEKYSDLKTKLTKKYGNPTGSYEYIGRKLYEESDEFYQCLRYSGCGTYISFFESKSGEVVALELKGLGRGKGYITIGYEGPSWSDALDAYKNKVSKSDEDAL